MYHLVRAHLVVALATPATRSATHNQGAAASVKEFGSSLSNRTVPSKWRPLAALGALFAPHLVRRMTTVSLASLQTEALTTIPRGLPLPSHATQRLIASYKLSARALTNRLSTARAEEI